jgi:hypothetical protein
MQTFDVYGMAFPKKNEEVQEECRQEHRSGHINRIDEYQKGNTQEAKAKAHGPLKEGS